MVDVTYMVDASRKKTRSAYEMDELNWPFYLEVMPSWSIDECACLFRGFDPRQYQECADKGECWVNDPEIHAGIVRFLKSHMDVNRITANDRDGTFWFKPRQVYDLYREKFPSWRFPQLLRAHFESQDRKDSSGKTHHNQEKCELRKEAIRLAVVKILQEKWDDARGTFNFPKIGYIQDIMLDPEYAPNWPAGCEINPSGRAVRDHISVVVDEIDVESIRLDIR